MTEKAIKAITPPEEKLQKVKKVSDPITADPKDITDFYRIPNKKYRTEMDVIRHHGFSVGAKLGKGACGDVFLAHHIQQGLDVAVKVAEIPADDETEDDRKQKRRERLIKSLKVELYALQVSSHPHIIQLIRHFVVDNRGQWTIYLFMKLAENGDLSSLLKNEGPFDEQTTKNWFAQMLSAMEYMHLRGMAHRDLKLSNILLDESMDVLISDFGMSQIVWRKNANNGIVAHTYCGTPPYMAPELLIKQDKSPEIQLESYEAFPVDVWALGVIVYNLLNKCYPFRTDVKPIQIAIGQMNKKKWKFISDIEPSIEVEDMLRQIFEPDPKKRPTVKQLTKNKWVANEYRLVDREYTRWQSSHLKNN